MAAITALRLLIVAWLLNTHSTTESPPERNGDAEGELPSEAPEVATAPADEQESDDSSSTSYLPFPIDDVSAMEAYQAGLSDDWLDSMAQFRVAIDTQTVTFTQIATLQRWIKPYGFTRSEWSESRQQLRDMLLDTLREMIHTWSVMQENGVILDSYYCYNSSTGAALTRGANGAVTLHVAITPDDPEIARLLTECERLGQEIAETLKGSGQGSDRELASKRVFAVIRGLLATLDFRLYERSQPATNGTAPSEMTATTKAPPPLDYYSEALKHARIYFEEIARRYIYNLYFIAAIGVALVGVGIGLILGLFMWLDFSIVGELEDLWDAYRPKDTLLVCLLAGGGGAMVSVLERVRRWDLMVVGVPTTTMIKILGAARLLIGAAFALLVYSGVQANLIPFKIPDGAVEIYYWLILGFIAGFSERFAPDALAVTERQLAARDDGTSPTGNRVNP